MRSKVVGMTGKSRSGKDEFAKPFIREGGYVHVAFGDEVKRDVAKFVGLPLEQIEARKRDFYATLQEYGQRMLREKGENYWIGRAEPVVTRALDAGKDIIFTDVRLQREAEWVHALGGVIVKRIRAKHMGAGGMCAHHKLETELDSIRPDYVCNCSTVEDIGQHARKFLIQPVGDA